MVEHFPESTNIGKNRLHCTMREFGVRCLVQGSTYFAKVKILSDSVWKRHRFESCKSDLKCIKTLKDTLALQYISPAGQIGCFV